MGYLRVDQYGPSPTQGITNLRGCYLWHNNSIHVSWFMSMPGCLCHYYSLCSLLFIHFLLSQYLGVGGRERALISFLSLHWIQSNYVPFSQPNSESGEWKIFPKSHCIFRQQHNKCPRSQLFGSDDGQGNKRETPILKTDVATATCTRYKIQEFIGRNVCNNSIQWHVE